jgi:hypothetical protein
MPVPPNPDWLTPSPSPCGGGTTSILTLPDMQNVYDAAADTEQYNFNTALKVVSEITPAWWSPAYDAAGLAATSPEVMKSLQFLYEQGKLPTQITLEGGAAESTLAWSVPEAGALLLALQIAGDILNNNNNEAVELTDYHCAGAGEFYTAVATAKNPLGAQVDQVALFQSILDKLNQLLRCCNPCQEGLQNFVLAAPGLNTSPVYDNLSHILFSLTGESAYTWNQGGAAGFTHYGRFRWLDANGNSEAVEYIQSPIQRFYVPRDGQWQFEYYLNPTVEAVFQVYTREFWTFPAG